jgi:4-aminobutyrate aminotransferase-like enzyme
VLDVIEEEGLVERSAQLGETIRERMLAGRSVGRDRRRARPRAMLAIELVSDARSRTPAPDLTHASSTRRCSAACC